VEVEKVEDVLALLKERPDDAELYQLLGRLYLQRRALNEAWQAFMQSLRLNPDDPFTCLYFGTMLELCDDKKYSLDLYKHAIKLKPDLAVAHWCLGNLYRKQGKYDRAELSYERAVEVAPDDEMAQEKLAEWRTFIAKVRES
jgi:cytochrome c-type biogenesis protein CcmH/NrfG